MLAIPSTHLSLPGTWAGSSSNLNMASRWSRMARTMYSSIPRALCSSFLNLTTGFATLRIASYARMWHTVCTDGVDNVHAQEGCRTNVTVKGNTQCGKKARFIPRNIHNIKLLILKNQHLGLLTNEFERYKRKAEGCIKISGSCPDLKTNNISTSDKLIAFL